MDASGPPIFDWKVDGVCWKPSSDVCCESKKDHLQCNWQRNGTYPVTLVTLKGPVPLLVQRYKCSVHGGKASAADDRFREAVMPMAMSTRGERQHRWSCNWASVLFPSVPPREGDGNGGPTGMGD